MAPPQLAAPWDPARAAALEGDEVELLVYRSNLLGSDLRITNFGGGNTACKARAPDPLDPGREIDVLWVKGSGGDLGTLTRAGLASLSLERLRGLKRACRGREREDEMVPLFAQCAVLGSAAPPSIDTPLHALLPFPHTDHLHPDAILALACAADGERLAREVFGGRVGWLPWQRPGFDLALRLEALVAESPELRGVILAGHGLMSWGRTSRECFEASLDLIGTAGRFLEERLGGDPATRAFGARTLPVLPPGERRRRAAALGPVARGLAGRDGRVVGHFRDDPAVLDFLGRAKTASLVARGTSCPDHLLRTRLRPLLLDRPPDAPIEDCARRLAELVDAYRGEYASTYERLRRPDTPPRRGASPAIFLLPGVGMWSFGRSAAEARVAGEFLVNAVHVFRGAEGVSRYVGLPEPEAFAIEYWALEEAKLRRLPPERPLARQVALITGAAAGIGLASAERFLAEGAAVVLADVREEALRAAREDLAGRFGEDAARAVVLELRDPESVRRGIEAAVLLFGGLDVVVNNAGLSVGKPVAETTVEDYDLLNDVMPRGSFLVSREAVRVMREQGTGGSILYVASKNALAAGPENLAYGTAKAAQLHQMRLLAAEVGADGIRVNAVNPDAVIRGSGIWSGGWAEARARAHGIPVEKLGRYYAERTLLRREVTPEDVAAALFALASDLFSRTTGTVVPVDAGLPMAFPR